jgi:hypothetical protein
MTASNILVIDEGTSLHDLLQKISADAGLTLSLTYVSFIYLIGWFFK